MPTSPLQLRGSPKSARPSSSAVTIAGSSSANICQHVQPTSSVRRESRRSASVRDLLVCACASPPYPPRGRTPAAARLRRRACAAPSMNSICFTITCAMGLRDEHPMALNCSGVGDTDPASGESARHRDHIRIPRDHPCVQERIPVHRVLLAQPRWYSGYGFASTCGSRRWQRPRSVASTSSFF